MAKAKSRKQKRLFIAASYVLPGQGQLKGDFTIRETFAFNDRYIPLDEAAISGAMNATRVRFARKHNIDPESVSVESGPEKLSYRFHYSQKGADSADEYNAGRAIQYARWLAQRDGVTLQGNKVRVIWSGFCSATKTRSGRQWDGDKFINKDRAAYCKRVQAVEFGNEREEWKIVGSGRSRRGETTNHWDCIARIEIPNWDFEPVEPVEEIVADDSHIAPVAPAYRVPIRYLATSCLVAVNGRRPVAPSCAIRVAA